MHAFFDHIDAYEHRLNKIRRGLEVQSQPVTLAGPEVYPVLASVEPLMLDTLEDISKTLFGNTWQMVLGREEGDLPMTRSYLLGQIPVKLEEGPGQGAALVAYDPSGGGFQCRGVQAPGGTPQPRGAEYLKGGQCEDRLHQRHPQPPR
ncbi:hypothetical protein [Deinococcus altitudinis]|uniref:hypothetical protein n=1 Tax=Deinococcus altitudinis TaxID=468914 RepID=UPI0038928164